jgi:hypothetical protein
VSGPCILLPATEARSAAPFLLPANTGWEFLMLAAGEATLPHMLIGAISARDSSMTQDMDSFRSSTNC